jgi:hypothetical protein
MATADYGLLAGFKGIGGAMREGEQRALENQFNIAKLQMAQQSAASGGNSPAALQIANEYAKARASGDTQRMNDIELFTKALDKGLISGADGSVQTMGGYAPAIGGIEAAKAGMKQQAEKNVDLQMNPLIKQRESRAGEIGKQQGEKETLYKSSLSKLPQLNQVALDLSTLGKGASYTLGGRGTDTLARQFGVTTDTAKARTEYIAKVDNEILPLLRDTFGAAFTQKEGESLKATLGAPDVSPQEKDAVLRAFISSKYATLESMGRELGQTPDLPQAPIIGGQPIFDPMQARSAGLADPNESMRLPTKLKSPSKSAIQALMQNPDKAAEFDAYYGKGASRMVLGK